MKKKKHIPILVLAAIFALVSNGVSIQEHFCRMREYASFSVITEPSSCNMEKKVAACCSKKSASSLPNKGCCEQKSFFKKFNFEGFTAKIFSLQISDLIQFVTEHISIEIRIPFIHAFFTGLSPPYPDYEIAQYHQPTQPMLQVFIC